MKTTIKTIAAIIILISAAGRAQAQAIAEGSNVVSIGYGFPNLVGSVFETYESQNNYSNTSFGPIYAKYEHLLTDVVGIGINFAYASNKIEYNEADIFDINGTSYTYTIERVTYSILCRFNFHFVRKDKVDAYAGAGLGYRSAKWTYGSNDPNYIEGEIPNFFPMGFEMTAGLRYMFSPAFGLYGEVGFAKSPIQVGVSVGF